MTGVNQLSHPIRVKLLSGVSRRHLLETAHVYVAAFTAADVGERWDENSALEYIQYCLQRQPELCFIAITQRKVVGGIFGEIRRLDTEFLYIADIFVQPQYQMKGIAKTLFRTLVEESYKRYPHVRAIETLVDGTKTFPSGWYERIGMRRKVWVLISGSIEEALSRLYR
ncbi:MAG TPA: GNAT family N-acetyltransferase [Ktedonobacterales bacterium]|jgi:ribosomal protein S18 acetylase RimI-like enzyme